VFFPSFRKLRTGSVRRLTLNTPRNTPRANRLIMKALGSVGSVGNYFSTLTHARAHTIFKEGASNSHTPNIHQLREITAETRGVRRGVSSYTPPSLRSA